MRFPRSGGVLVHPTCFPSRFGIGDLGDGAYAFVDFLVKARQSIWQLLPLGPTGFADSPYQSFSAFAGSPMLISPDQMVLDGLMPADLVSEVPFSLLTASISARSFNINLDFSNKPS